MTSRVVKIYDGPFPTVDDMMFGDPATRTPFPRKTWADQMEEGEVALFCVNFKNQLPVREEDARPGSRSDEVCRVSSDVSELQMHAREIVRLHPSTICVLRRKDGSEIKRISNRRFLWRFALSAYLGIGIWLVLLTALGTGIIWILRGLAIRRFDLPGHASAFSLAEWAVLLAGGAVIGISVVFGSVWFRARRRARQFHRLVVETLTPEEKLRYQEINRLSVSVNPEDRQRLRQLSKEYSDRLSQIRRSKKLGRSSMSDD